MNTTIANYSFSAAASTITFSDYSSIALERIVSVFNITKGRMIYDGSSGLNGTAATNILTVDYNTIDGMANTDQLRIIYDDTTPITGYPSGSTPLASSSGNVAAATATATLAKATGKTTYITGFVVSGSGAVAGLPVIVTVTGILGGTLSYIYTAAVGALITNQPLIVNFPVPVPASATNVDIVVSCPSLGTGATNNTVSATGFRV